MKLAYYVSDIAQDNSDHEVHNSGDHEVHNSGCPHFDRIQSKTYLGLFDNCAEAVIEAKKNTTSQMVVIGVVTNATCHTS